LKAHSVSEKYYFARGPQLVNRVVDIGPVFEAKLASLRSCRTMVTHMIRGLNATLLEQKRRLPALSGDENAAIEEYTKVALENRDRAMGRKYGLDYAEPFHYIGPDQTMADYVSRNAVSL